LGRASRRKRERREAARQEPFTRLELASAMKVICAASISPTASHRLPSLTSAFLELLHRDRQGEVTATQDHLDELLVGGVEGARSRGLPLATSEDFFPLDIRDEVSAPFRGELHRLIPGGWEAPVSIVEDAALGSQAFDRFLIPALGFGVGDLIELALRYGDHLIGSLRGSWPRDVAAEPFMPARISATEIQAREMCSTLGEVAARCFVPDRALRAAAWATRDLAEARQRFAHSGNSLGAAIAVRSGGKEFAVPGGLLLDTIHEGASELRDIALTIDEARSHWRDASRHYVLDRVAALGPVALDVDAGAGEITALQLVNEHLLFAIDVVPLGLDAAGVSEARRRLAAFAPGADFSSHLGSQRIPEAAEVAHAVILVGLGDFMDLIAAEEAHIPLLEAQVLRWMVATSARPDDVPRFLLDRAQDRGRQFSFGPFDEWEVWRSGDIGVHGIGVRPTFTVVDPHGEAAEWERHRDLADVEHALAAAKLAPLVDWTQVSGKLEDGGTVHLTHYPRRLNVRVARTSEGPLIAIASDLVSDGHVPADRVARAVLWRLRHMDWSAGLLLSHGSDCLRIWVRHSTDVVAGGAVAERSAEAIMLIYNDPDPHQDDPASVLERSVGEALRDVVPGTSQDDFLDAWTASPPGLAIDVKAVPQAVADPGPFEPPHPAIASHERRWLARQLADADLSPGTRSGSEASALEAHIYATLDERFESRLADLNWESALPRALADLERLHADRIRHDDDINRRCRLHAAAKTDVDLESVVEEREELVLHIRSVSLIVETLVRDRPTGRTPLGGRERQQLYALAQLMVESGLRRDALDYGLADTSIEVTDVFEIRLHAGTANFDNANFIQARIAASLPSPTPAVPADELAETALRKGRQDLNTALEETCGFALDHVAAILDAATGWETSTYDSLVVATSRDSLVAKAHELTDLDMDELRAAFDQLLLRREKLQGLIEHWKLDQRPYRFATRPFVENAARDVLVCPYSAAYSRAIISGHLSDLRSPWADAIPGNLTNRLARMRQDRNKVFETQVADRLGEIFTVRPNVKKDTRLGGWLTEREIDAICIDPSRRRLWVVEAKDPAADFVARQIGRSIERFYGDDGYVPKLMGSVERARTALSSVLTELGFSNDADDGWTVHGAMVTRRVEAAAFYGTTDVWFMTLDSAAATLDRDRLPDATYGLLREPTERG
jgi:hypothetical protein